MVIGKNLFKSETVAMSVRVKLKNKQSCSLLNDEINYVLSKYNCEESMNLSKTVEILIENVFLEHDKILLIDNHLFSINEINDIYEDDFLQKFKKLFFMRFPSEEDIINFLNEKFYDLIEVEIESILNEISNIEDGIIEIDSSKGKEFTDLYNKYYDYFQEKLIKYDEENFNLKGEILNKILDYKRDSFSIANDKIEDFEILDFFKKDMKLKIYNSINKDYYRFVLNYSEIQNIPFIKRINKMCSLVDTIVEEYFKCYDKENLIECIKNIEIFKKINEL